MAVGWVMKCTSLCGLCPGERNVCCSCTLASYLNQCHDHSVIWCHNCGTGWYRPTSQQCDNSSVITLSLWGRLIQTVPEGNSCYGHFRKTRLLETYVKWFRLQLLHSYYETIVCGMLHAYHIPNWCPTFQGYIVVYSM